MAPVQGYARPPERVAPVERSYAPARPAAESYNRAPLEAYNRTPAPISRPQTYSRPESRLAYGPEAYGGSARSYSAPAQTYRAPAESYPRTDYGRSSGFNSFQSMGSKSFKSYEKAEKSSGSRMFGGDGYKEPKFKEPSFKEPKYSAPKFKEPKAPKMSGGGHSSGHSSGHRW
jgi:hypothetical protein